MQNQARWLLGALAMSGLLAWFGYPRPGFVETRRIFIYRQSAPNTCGPTALLSICRYYGIRTTEAQLAQLAGTTATGTTLAGLANAAQAVGLEATGMQLSLAELEQAPKPLIAHTGGHHFVVVVSSRNQHLTLIDPAHGARSIPVHDFSQSWKGIALLLEPRS